MSRRAWFPSAGSILGVASPWVRPNDLAAVELPRPVILINGAFDLLHAGHLRLIGVARQRAGRGTLICALDSDEKVREGKGIGRPILTWAERATAIGRLPIDYLVEIATLADMEQLVAAAQPDLRVQGGDYAAASSRFPTIPKLFVPNRGVHTSTIIQRILERRPTTTN